MKTIDDIISTLPEAFRPLADTYVDLTVMQIEQRLLDIYDLLSNSRGATLLALGVAGLTMDELSAMLDAVNTDLEEITRKKAEFNSATRLLIRRSLSIGIGILIAKSRADASPEAAL